MAPPGVQWKPRTQERGSRRALGAHIVARRSSTTYDSRVMETLGLHRTAELALYAVKKGLVHPQ